jgi:hypothetical protein
VDDGLESITSEGLTLEWAPLVYVASLSASMLWLAFRNYRHGEMSIRRVAFQVVCVAALITLVMTAEFFVSAAAGLR